MDAKPKTWVSSMVQRLCYVSRRVDGVQVSSLVQPRAGYVEAVSRSVCDVSWHTAVRERVSTSIVSVDDRCAFSRQRRGTTHPIDASKFHRRHTPGAQTSLERPL